MRRIKLKESDLNKLIKKVLLEDKLYSGGLIQQGDDVCEIICKRKYAAFGSNGEVVKMIQHLLGANGFNPKYSGGGMKTGCDTEYPSCDGKFRKHTSDAVKEFQRKYNLTDDGAVGADTLKAMCDNLKFTNSLSKDNFCKKCDCDKQNTEDNDNDTDIIQDIDMEILNIDCNILKRCVFDNILNIPAPNYNNFLSCLKKKKVVRDDKSKGKVYQCTYIEQDVRIPCPKYLDKMPKIGDKYFEHWSQDSVNKVIQACEKAGCTKRVY